MRTILLPTVVALAILALLVATVVFVRVDPGHGEHRIADVRRDIRDLSIAVDMYTKDCAVVPTDSQGIQALLVNPGVAGWRGPYWKQKPMPIDPWGVPYRYNTSTNGFDIRSAGPDKTFGTADDLTR